MRMTLQGEKKSVIVIMIIGEEREQEEKVGKTVSTEVNQIAAQSGMMSNERTDTANIFKDRKQQQRGREGFFFYFA